MTMKVNVKVNVKKKYIVNGKEYDSIEHMPDDIRLAFEKGQTLQTKESVSDARIIFNGQEYESMDAMPDDVRNTYETVLNTLSEGEGSGDKSERELVGSLISDQKEKTSLRIGAPKPIKPGSSFSPWLVFGVILFLVLLGLYMYTHI